MKGLHALQLLCVRSLKVCLLGVLLPYYQRLDVTNAVLCLNTILSQVGKEALPTAAARRTGHERNPELAVAVTRRLTLRLLCGHHRRIAVHAHISIVTCLSHATDEWKLPHQRKMVVKAKSISSAFSLRHAVGDENTRISHV